MWKLFSRKPASIKQNDEISRQSNIRITQNFRLVWLDKNIDAINDEDSINTITQLRKIVNTVTNFLDPDQCIEFIKSIENEKLFMICSGELGQTIVPIIHEMSQIICIFIFCMDKERHEQWAYRWSKIKDVYTDITLICEALKQAALDCDRNSISISFFKTTDGISKENLNTLDASFMYTSILKEILLTIDFEQVHIEEFSTYCREQFIGNNIELTNVDMFETEYHDHRPIWWYTYDCFLYSMLNRALRLMEIDLIIKLGFFLKDLHQHIILLYTEQNEADNQLPSLVVYRGQGLSEKDFNELKKTEGGLLSFNNFLSTSKDCNISYEFIRRTITSSNLIGILFVIEIDPRTSSTTPFANVKNISYYQGEEEILFSMHSIFRIKEIKQIDTNNRLWQVDLTLTNDNDPQLGALTKSLQEQIEGSSGWLRLGKLMIILGQFNKAEELYRTVLKQTPNESKQGHLYHMLGHVKNDQGNYSEAIKYYEKAIQIEQQTSSSTQADLAASYTGLGMGYNMMGDYTKALSYYEIALEIKQKTLPSNHSSLATSYNNIGSVLNKIGKYSKALSYYDRVFEIYKENLPNNHPNFAAIYNNIGMVYKKMGVYSKTLSYYEKALEIWEKILPANHPDLATAYNNIGNVYSNMGEYTKGLFYYEKALEIKQQTFPAHHATFATSFNNIGNMYNKMSEYIKALSYYEQALEIYRITLSMNHPDLATSYHNIGWVYKKMGDYSKALLYFEQALPIFQQTLPADHPTIKNIRENIDILQKEHIDIK